MYWRHHIGMLYCIWHFSASILHNSNMLWTDMMKAGSAVSYQKRLAAALKNPWARHPAQLAGLHGSYCFYGPAVGGSYHSIFVVQDRGGTPQKRFLDPNLNSYASKIRYRSLLEHSDGWLVDTSPKGRSEILPLAQAMATSICLYVGKLYPDHQVNCSYLLQGVNTIAALGTDRTISHILLFETQTVYHAANTTDDDDATSGFAPFALWYRHTTRRGDDTPMA